MSLVKFPYKSGVLVGAKDRIVYLSHKRQHEKLDYWRRRCAQELRDVTQRVLQTLGGYEPKLLGMYRKNEDWYSQPLGFLHYLVNWEDADVRVPRMPIRDYLGRNRPIFGTETMEMRGWTKSQLGAFLSVKEYPDMTGLRHARPVPQPAGRGGHHAVLPFRGPADLNQGNRGSAKRLDQSEDKAEDQIDDLTDAMSDVASGRVAMGWHHLSVLVKAADNQLAVAGPRAGGGRGLLHRPQYPGHTGNAESRSLLLGAAAGEFSVRCTQAPHLHDEPRGVCEPAQLLARSSGRQLVGQGDHGPGDREQDAVLPEFPLRKWAVSARPCARRRRRPAEGNRPCSICSSRRRNGSIRGIFYFDDKNGGEIFARACGAAVTDVALGEPSEVQSPGAARQPRQPRLPVAVAGEPPRGGRRPA